MTEPAEVDVTPWSERCSRCGKLLTAHGSECVLVTSRQVPSTPQYGGSPIAAALFRSDHSDHDVGWRHEDGRLYSATCHDCGSTFQAWEDDNEI